MATSFPLPDLTLPPGVIPTHGNAQDPAHGFDGILVLMGGYEPIFHQDSREKMLTAFFTMSRSCRVTSSSRLRRRISSSCSV
jgi:hypothetical protein